MFESKLKKRSLGVLLVGIAILGPAVAFAGVSVIYPSSQQTAAVDTTPPITFSAGGDLAAAAAAGLAGAATLTTADNGAAFSVTLSGLSGGTVTIDDYVAIAKGSGVASYKLQVASALSGSLTAPTVLTVRLWTGETAPTADDSLGVCAVLDLKATAATESSAACSASAKMQLVYQLPTDASGSSTVSLRPSSIVLA